MNKHFKIVILFSFISIFNKAQNLILNPTFSEVKLRSDTTKPYKILPGNQSNVKNWYLPNFINYNIIVSRLGQEKYSSTKYFSSRNKSYITRNKRYNYSNFDEFYGNNLGFIGIRINNYYSVSLIQQKLDKPLEKGKYCFKIKYKYNHIYSSRNGKAKIEICFSNNDLKKYYIKTKLQVPINLIKGEIKDSTQSTDENTPWQQKCYVFDLNGDENYLTIGSLSNTDKYSLDWAYYMIDDLELYKYNENGCNCEEVNKDLRQKHKREFPIEKIISSDSLVMYRPPGSTPCIISEDAKHYLNELISFLQRNTNLKINFMVHENSNNINISPTSANCFIYYLTFYGVNKNRISSITTFCKDEGSIYCGFKAEYEKISFKLYN